MAKKQYMRPLLLSIDPAESDPTIHFGNSSTTIGEDSRFTWDDSIADFEELFYANGYGEETLDAIDVNDDFFITEDEFYAWFDEVEPW